MTLIIVILVLMFGRVEYIAPVPSFLVTCDRAMLDNIAAYIPPHYGSFAELMLTEAGSPALSATVLTPNCTLSVR